MIVSVISHHYIVINWSVDVTGDRPAPRAPTADNAEKGCASYTGYGIETEVEFEKLIRADS